MQQKEILRGYEVGRWDIGPRMYKIFAAATILAILPLFVVAQLNLISTSACDSPFVGRVCEVLDTVYTGAKMFAKDQGYIDEVYENQELARTNEVIWNEVIEGERQLEYPVGYFLIANRDEIAAKEALEAENPGSAFSIAPAPFTPSPLKPAPSRSISPPIARSRRNRNIKPILPKRNPKVLDGKLDDDPLGDLMGSVEDDDNKNPKTGPETKKTPDPKAVAQNKKPVNPLENNKTTQSETLSDVKINKKPLYDFADKALEQYTKKEVDLTQQFKVRMTGAIDPNGILIVERSAITEIEGDEAMRELAIEAIQKVGISGWLRYLSDEDVSKLNILFGQNDTHLVADVVSDLKDSKKAKSTASVLQLAMLLAKKGGKLKEDELLLLKSAKITTEGTLLRITFNLDKPVAQKMMVARLADYKRKKEEEAKKTGNNGKPSGHVIRSKDGSNTAR